MRASLSRYAYGFSTYCFCMFYEGNFARLSYIVHCNGQELLFFDFPA